MDDKLEYLLERFASSTLDPDEMKELIKDETTKVYIERSEDLTNYEKAFIAYNENIHKIGWVTWITKDNIIRVEAGKSNYYLPENNLYRINFDSRSFTSISKEEYHERARNQ